MTPFDFFLIIYETQVESEMDLFARIVVAAEKFLNVSGNPF